MTAKEFVDLYKGRRARVNEYSGDRFAGMIGVVAGLTDRLNVRVDLIEGGWIGFDVREIELIEEPDNKPLPLPG